MKSIPAILIVAAVLTMKNGFADVDQKLVLKTTFTIFNPEKKFGTSDRQVNRPVYGSKVRFECESPIEGTTIIENLSKNKTIKHCKDTKCEHDEHIEKLDFGVYRCTRTPFIGTADDLMFSNTFNYNNRTCSDIECADCQKDQWCLMMRNGSNCVSDRVQEKCGVSGWWCPLSHTATCNENPWIGDRSLSVENKWNVALVRYSNLAVCPSGIGKTTPHVVYRGKMKGYQERILLQRDYPFLTLSNLSKINGQTFEVIEFEINALPSEEEIIAKKLIFSATPEEKNQNQKSVKIDLQGPLDYAKSKRIQKMNFTASVRYGKDTGNDGEAVIVYFENILIDYGSFKISVLEPRSNQSRAYRVECIPDFRFENDTKPPNFNYDQRWITTMPKKSVPQQGPIEMREEDAIGVYCIVEIKYSVCDPFEQVNQTLNLSLEDAINAFKPTTILPTDSPIKDKPDSGLNDKKTVYIVGFVVLGIVLLAAGAFVAFLVLQKRKKKQSRNKALQATYKDKKNVLAIAELRQLACEVIGSHDLAQKLRTVIIDRTKENEDDIRGDRIKMQDCRHPELALKVSTRVKIDELKDGGSLHLSKMHGYVENPMLIGQSPKKKQYEEHAEAIWKERVGTVVIVIECDTNGEPVNGGYISTQDGGRVRSGKFTAFTEAALKSPGEFSQFAIELSKVKKHHTEKRSINVIHVDGNVMPSKMVDVIELIEGSQEKKANEKLPGMLFECPSGAERSASLLTAFIARQMWMRNKSINMVGLLRYIRRNRFGVFSVGDGIRELQITLGMVQIIATRSEMGNVGMLTVEAHERDVFDPRLRRKELEEAVMTSVRTDRDSERSKTTRGPGSMHV